MNAVQANTSRRRLDAQAVALSSAVSLPLAILVGAWSCAVAATASSGVADPAPLPRAATTLRANADECAVWRRELSFARSVETHDAAAFAAHVDPGAVFDAGSADATRGRDAIVADWKDIVDERGPVLRWRPGIVDIGADATVAVSRGPYILQVPRPGQAPSVSVGLYQTVWRRAADGIWRVVFDGSASAPMAVDGRAAADAWVRQQPMSDCAPA